MFAFNILPEVDKTACSNVRLPLSSACGLVDIVTRLPTRNTKHPTVIPSKVRNFSLVQTVQPDPGASPASYLVATENYFSRDKAIVT
jgi:hypothetical protein